ncbi:hypothetical protein KBB08_03825 [Candidatus Gracilibacteria bacterium]|nr:hypothetical protein [Candidatus Gracilibacteria bacterium]
MENIQTSPEKNRVELSSLQLSVLLIVCVLLSALISGLSVYYWQKSANEKVLRNLEEYVSVQSTSYIEPQANKFARLEQMLERYRYLPVPKYKLALQDGNKYRYEFDKGGVREGTKNYSIVIPDSWSVLSYTNQSTADTYGTNILLQKGSDFIRINQQLQESPSCVFEEAEVAGMAGLCTLITTLEPTHSAWKVYTVPESVAGSAATQDWVRYGVCDQDSYAMGISSASGPDEHDKKVCILWTDIGEIELFLSSGSPQSYDEFIEILKRIEIVE